MVQNTGGCSLYFPIRLRCATVADVLTNPELEDALARALGRAFTHARTALPTAAAIGDGVALQPPQLMKGDLTTNDATALLARISRAIETAARAQALPLHRLTPAFKKGEARVTAGLAVESADVSEPFNAQRFNPITYTYDVPSYKGSRHKVSVKADHRKPLALILKDQHVALLQDILRDYQALRQGQELPGPNRFVQLLEHVALLLTIVNSDETATFSRLFDQFTAERMELSAANPNIGQFIKRWDERIIEHIRQELVIPAPFEQAAALPEDVNFIKSLLLEEAELEQQLSMQIAKLEWYVYPNIQKHYKGWEDYWKVRDQVEHWTDPTIEDDPAHYIEEAIDEWNAYTDIHDQFGDEKNDNFDGNPENSYLNIKRLYKALAGKNAALRNPASYIHNEILPNKFTFHVAGAQKPITTHVYKEWLAVLEEVRDILGKEAPIFGRETFAFVPRTQRGKVNTISNHALGRAIDVTPGENPRITSPDIFLVINAVCLDVLPLPGLLPDTKLETQQRASEFFQKHYDTWRTYIEQRYLDMTQKSRPLKLAHQAILVEALQPERRKGQQVTELDYVTQLVTSIDRRHKELNRYAATGFLSMLEVLIGPLKQLAEWQKSQGLRELSKVLASKVTLPEEQDDILVINAVCASVLPRGLQAVMMDINALQSASDYFKKHFTAQWVKQQKQRLRDMTEKSALLPPSLEHQKMLMHKTGQPVTEREYITRLYQAIHGHQSELKKYAEKGFVNVGGDLEQIFKQVAHKQRLNPRWGGEYHTSKDYMHFELLFK